MLTVTIVYTYDEDYKLMLPAIGLPNCHGMSYIHYCSWVLLNYSWTTIVADQSDLFTLLMTYIIIIL